MSHNQSHVLLTDLLIDLEGELRHLGLWEEQAPSPEKLQSLMPFAVDTLAFHQWLQFIFVEKCYQLIDAEANLPSGASILPMAEEVYANQTGKRPLLETIAKIDELLA